jgi:hypothetical protein
MAKKKATKKAVKKAAKKAKKPAKKAKSAKRKRKPPRAKADKRPKNRPTSRRPAVPTTADSTGLPALRVRMYRQGLGDCFLLTFGGGGDERHMLIDCGSLGSTTTKVKIKQVADDVLATINNGRLHIVVATHEHQDHVSGFSGTNGPMKQLQGKVDHVWLAWTENPIDPDAKRIVKFKHDLGTALTALAATMPDSPAVAHVADLLGFAGHDPSLMGASDFAKTVDEAMEFIRSGLGATTTYYEPGKVIEEPWLPGFRIYVLGPPRADESLADLGEHGSEDLYHVSLGQRSAAAMLHAAARGVEAGANSPDMAACEAALPFDRRFNGRGEDLLRSQYPGYLNAADDWRSIDEDWLNIAADLALQLDNMTNNTSLALAIERIADGKVLLFPADAQQGNWLSWHAPNLSWTISENGTERRVTASELLARTVFYKVGHHASHNATASRMGLELMAREDDLVAFIPVDRAVAMTRGKKGSWKMPARPLYRRLLEKCQGRVARSDLGWADDAALLTNAAQRKTEQELRDLFTTSEWNAWRTSQQSASHVEIEDLYVQYTLV